LKTKHTTEAIWNSCLTEVKNQKNRSWKWSQ